MKQQLIAEIRKAKKIKTYCEISNGIYCYIKLEKKEVLRIINENLSDFEIDSMYRNLRKTNNYIFLN
jgi:hypothetical protein